MYVYLWPRAEASYKLKSFFSPSPHLNAALAPFTSINKISTTKFLWLQKLHYNIMYKTIYKDSCRNFLHNHEYRHSSSIYRETKACKKKRRCDASAERCEDENLKSIIRQKTFFCCLFKKISAQVKRKMLHKERKILCIKKFLDT